jgi:tetratricopeptide (TPR) repeat protein
VLLAVRGETCVTLRGRGRVVVAGTLLPFLVVALLAHGGNGAVGDSEIALEREDALQALAEARSARDWMPWSSLPFELEGEAAIALERPREAELALQRAIELDPGNWRTWYDLAVVSDGKARQDAVAEGLRLSPELLDLRTAS